MALGTQEKAIYLTGYQGKIYLSSDKSHEKGWTFISGQITGLELVPKTYEGRDYRALQITIVDGDTYKLEVSEGSKNYKNLIGFFRNSDLSKPIQINSSLDTGKDGTKKDTSFTVTDQNSPKNSWVKSYFQKDTETELPPLLEIKHPKTGKHISWDATDQLEVLERILNEDLKPQLVTASSQTAVPAQNHEETEDTEVDYDDENPDDLPF